MRLIDADRLLEDKRIEKYYHLKNGDIAIPLIDIKHAPTIEERKTGTWCCSPDGKIFCSNCQRVPTNRILVNGSLVYDMTPIREKMKYCPNCGADMRGEEHGEV